MLSSCFHVENNFNSQVTHLISSYLKNPKGNVSEMLLYRLKGRTGLKFKRSPGYILCCLMVAKKIQNSETCRTHTVAKLDLK